MTENYPEKITEMQAEDKKKKQKNQLNSAWGRRRLMLVFMAAVLLVSVIFTRSAVTFADETGTEAGADGKTVTGTEAGADGKTVMGADSKAGAGNETNTGKGKTVRAGWFESNFFQKDKYGRRSGYGYEYQRKVAAYTGWKYEYVEGTWSDLLQMLKDGEIDILTDVSYMEERTKEMLYTSSPMGSESYYVYVPRNSKDIREEDTSSLNGKRVGVDKTSIQEGLFTEWAKVHGIKADLIEISVTQEKAKQMLQSGEMDAYVMLDSFGDAGLFEPLWKVGSADFYFAVSKNREDLHKELDDALGKIQDENNNYNNELYDKYMAGSGSNHYLSLTEQEWLAGHGKIRVGYQDSYLAFCAKDESTGELTGALKDYLAYASTGLENAELEFEPVCYPTSSAALEAMKRGEVDCVFPSNLTDYDGEEIGVVITPPLMTTEMDAVIRADEQKEFIKKKDVTVAVNQGNTNYEMFLNDHFPGWKVAYFKDTPEGLDAVAAGKADCVIISNYRFSNISKQCEELHLTTVYTGVNMDYCFAVCEGESELYSVLSKITFVVPKATTNAALTYYSMEDVKVGFLDLIKDNIGLVLLVVGLVVLIIFLLLIRSIRAEKKAAKEHHLVKDLNRKVFVDALTNVRNKGAFTEYVKKLQKKIDKGGDVDFAMGMLDCDNLKKINDEYGHDKGDIYLKGASRLICHVFRYSPVFRIGGDEFAVVLENEDYRNMEGVIKSFYRRKKEICSLAENEWDEVRISMGIATYDPGQDDNLYDTIRRADKIMYENKRIGKKIEGKDA